MRSQYAIRADGTGFGELFLIGELCDGLYRNSTRCKCLYCRVLAFAPMRTTPRMLMLYLTAGMPALAQLRIICWIRLIWRSRKGLWPSIMAPISAAEM